jgi:hypothetical protein
MDYESNREPWADQEHTIRQRLIDARMLDTSTQAKRVHATPRHCPEHLD